MDHRGSELLFEATTLSLEDAKKEYLKALKELKNAAFKMLLIWERRDIGELLMNKEVEDAYPFNNASFDEWWHEVANFEEKVEDNFKK